MDLKTIKDVIKKYGTPVYIYDGEIIRSAYNKLKTSLPSKFEIFYSVKANPLAAICKLFQGLGSGIEVSSSGELYIALQTGFSPQNIIFTGPGKTQKELEYAIENDIYCISIESPEEAVIINKIAIEKSKKVNISLRINPDFNLSGANIKMSGIPSQFGIDQDQTDMAFKIFDTLNNIAIIGVHVYLGTQILSAENIAGNIEEIMNIAIGLSAKYGFKLDFLDLGGGFGVPYFANETGPDMQKLKSMVADIYNKFEALLADTRIIVESGRFLMAESGSYYTKILYRKECRGNIYLVCDGGSNHHASSAFLGRHIRNNFPMHILEKDDDIEEVNVVGPLCTSTDVLGQKVKLAKAGPGDILVIEKSGAYGLTHSPVYFLSHPSPAEILYMDDTVYVLRERGRVEDIIKGQRYTF